MNSDTDSRTGAPEPDAGVIPELVPVELQTLSLLLTTGATLDELLRDWALLLTTHQLVKAPFES